MLVNKDRIGFNVSKSKLQLIEIVKQNNEFYIENIDESYFNELLNFNEDKETKILSNLQLAFNDLNLKNNLKSQIASFSLSPHFFYIYQIPYENSLLSKDLLKEIKWEFSILYPFLDSNDFIFQFYEVEKNPLKIENTIIVLAINKKSANVISNFCKNNNLKLSTIDYAHFASDLSLSLSSLELQNSLVLSLYFSDNILSIELLYNRKPIFLEVISVQDISKINQIINENLFYRDDINLEKKNISQVFISGENVSRNFVNYLEKKLEKKFNLFNPLSFVKVKSQVIKNINYLEKNNSFSSAAGIAYRML
ncbi:MAG: hypothetical protein STSR0008_05320 [Ignavibacterium sp.]